jgi:hypothetical protein
LDFVRSGIYDWLLYSNDQKNTDCFLFNYRYFCRSTHDNSLTKKLNLRCVNGELWAFFKLKENKVTTDELLKWLIPFDIIEEYAEYSNRIYIPVDENNTICNCTDNRIGLSCEYELVNCRTEIPRLIQTQRGVYRVNKNQIPTSFIDQMSCNAGAFALEWRQICDGIVNCQNAIDELKLSFIIISSM